MRNGEIRIGQVVTLGGRRRRYLVTAVMRAERLGFQADNICARALSGAVPGSGPSGLHPEGIELSADQRIAFTGAAARHLRTSALGALNGVGRMSLRDEGEDVIEGRNLEALIARVAMAPQ